MRSLFGKDKNRDARAYALIQGDQTDVERQRSAGAGRLSKQDVIQWFNEDASPEDAAWVLGTLEERMPDLLAERGLAAMKETHSVRPKVKLYPSAEDLSKSGRGNLVIEMAACEEELLQAVHIAKNEERPTLTPSSGTVVQFGAEIYFVSEGDEMLVLNLLRIGNLEGSCSVKYATKAVSAIAGVHFEDVHGTMTFEPGQRQAEICVRIYDNDNWNTTMEFQVVLLHGSCAGCVLGQFLSQTRVKVIDDDVFPSNRCKDAVLEGDASRLGQFTLFIDYVRICWTDPVIRSGSIKWFLTDLCDIVHSGLILLTNAYLVDVVFKNKDLEDKPELARIRLVVCALLMVLPTLVLHVLNYRKPSWKVGGRCRGFLQNALFRRFLDYDDATRAKHQPGSTIMAVTRDVQTVVDKGYMSTLSLAKSLCSVIGMVIFKLIGNRLFGVAVSPALVLALIAFPVMIVPFVLLRKDTLASYIYAQTTAQDVIADTVASSVEDFRLMYDYHERAKKALEFDGSINGFNAATISVLQVSANNHYFVAWIGIAVTAVYTIIRGAMVIEGSCPLGIYLMDIQIFLQMKVAFSGLFQVLMAITSVKPALEGITTLLNLPTSLSSEKALSRNRMKLSRGCIGEGGKNPDELPIRLRYLRYDYTPRDTSTQISKIHLDGNVELAQGQMIAISGPSGQGKTTVLKLIAGVLRPHETDQDVPTVFVPSHLRALHVTVQPLFFFGTLYENLTYGIPAQRREDARLDRVQAICRKLGVEERAVACLSTSAKMKWGEVFSFSQLCLLNLARALVFNPEILCIHYPAIAFSDEGRATVFKVLREFVAMRGIELEEDVSGLRRPRTCLYTVTGHTGVLAADKVLVISSTGLQLLESTQRDALAKVDALAAPEGRATAASTK